MIRWMEQCTCSMWLNVGDCTKINCTWRLKTVTNYYFFITVVLFSVITDTDASVFFKSARTHAHTLAACNPARCKHSIVRVHDVTVLKQALSCIIRKVPVRESPWCKLSHGFRVQRVMMVILYLLLPPPPLLLFFSAKPP